MTRIDHGDNDPFVRAARSATAEGQTETVYAIRVEYKKSPPEFWNVSSSRHTEEGVTDMRNWIYRSRDARTILSAELVSRRVTITADDWTPLVGGDTPEPKGTT